MSTIRIVLLLIFLSGCKEDINSKCFKIKKNDGIEKLKSLYDFSKIKLVRVINDEYFHYVTNDNCEFKFIKYKNKILEVKYTLFSDIGYIDTNNPNIFIKSKGNEK